jgi:hypothetical protein
MAATAELAELVVRAARVTPRASTPLVVTVVTPVTAASAATVSTALRELLSESTAPMVVTAAPVATAVTQVPAA